jgi:hypothetical protein
MLAPVLFLEAVAEVESSYFLEAEAVKQRKRRQLGWPAKKKSERLPKRPLKKLPKRPLKKLLD